METSPQEAAFNLAIKKWQIIDGNFTYDDPSMEIHTELLGINHIGSGDFSQDISDLITNTSVASVGLNYEGINYFKGKTLDVALNMKMDFKASKYSFSENKCEKFQILQQKKTGGYQSTWVLHNIRLLSVYFERLQASTR